jgi:cytochrome c
MHSLRRLDAIPFIALILLALVLWSCSSATAPPLAQGGVQPPSRTPDARASGAATPTRTPVANHQWILIDLPPNATQLDYGAEVYRLVCRDCHGDRGQGLTPEWRATWAPADQNCWQAKCHGDSHPSDGFKLPVSPPIVGQAVLSRFDTADDLYQLIQNEMPWYNPGSLTEKDAWAVTAFVIKLNRMNPGTLLGPDTAPNFHLP